LFLGTARVPRVPDIDRVSTMFKDPPAGQRMEYGGAHAVGQLGPVWLEVLGNRRSNIFGGYS